jgi:hypothetical protein
MSIAIGWLGIIIGIAGCVLGYLRCRSGGSAAVESSSGGQTNSAIGLTLVITLLFWAVSMIRKEPFSTGQTLGLGFLIGGISGALADALSERISCDGSARTDRSSAHAMASFALFASSVTFLIFRSDPEWALSGFAIGAVMAGILQRYLLGSDARSGARVEEWALYSTAISAGIVLAMQHFDQTAQRGYWAFPILIATTALIGSFVGIEAERREGSYLLSTLISSVITIGLSAVYAWRLANDWSLLGAVTAGIAAFAIAAWLSGTRSQDPRISGTNPAAISVLAIVTFAVLAFKLWSGLGVALGLIAAFSVACPVTASGNEDDGRMLRDLFSFGLSIFLFKLFIESYRGELARVDLRIHYAFVGAVLGAMLPMILLSFLFGNGEKGRSGRVAAIGFVTAAAPLLFFLVWEIKAVLGFIFGTAVAAALLCFLRSTGECEESSLCEYPGSLLIIGAQLAAIRFVRPLIDLDLTRINRIYVLSASIVVLSIVFAVSGHRSRTEDEDAR